jgi:predicted lipoprotein with Yx(FWY)xxD motif
MISLKRFFVGPLVIAFLVAGCSSTAATNPPAGATGPAGGSSSTIVTSTVGGVAILVAGSNGMSLYEFASDTAGNGKSACTGTCATTWPPLTVASGTTPTVTGASGALATLTRDDGTTQVTYAGHPLYFYSGDSAPGDTNGNYPGWSTAKP